MTPSYKLVTTTLRTLMLATGVGWTALGAQQVPPIPAATGTGMISGQVIDSETRQGIAGATVIVGQVRLAPSAGGAPAPATARATAPPVRADSQGRFAFTGLVAGNYLVIAELPGYSSSPSVSGRSVKLADGATVSDARLQLTKLATISGTVRDDGGDPIVGVGVMTFRRAIVNGRPPVLVLGGRSQTDDRGQYRITQLMPGEYYVCACTREPIPFDGPLLTTLAARPLDLLAVATRAAKVGADAASLDANLRTFAPTFHPNTTLAGRAVVVKASGAEPKTAIDIDVTHVRAARVSGRVIGITNGSLNANAIRLVRAGDIPEADAISQLVPMLVQPDGRFDFAGVPAGQYELEVLFAPGSTGGAGGPSGAALLFIGGRGVGMPGGQASGPPADGLWGSLPVTVGDEDVTGVAVGLQPGVVITGKLAFTGSAPLPAAGVTRGFLSLTPITLRPARPMTFNTQLRPDGTFRFGSVVPGRYALNAGLVFPGWPTMKSVTVKGVDVTDTALTLEADADMVITMSDVPLASLSGSVTMSSGDTGADWFVRVFPSDPRTWDEPFAAVRRFRQARLSATGTFTLPGLPEGEYFIVAHPAGTADWMQRTELEALSKGAMRISLADGQKQVVEVRR